MSEAFKPVVIEGGGNFSEIDDDARQLGGPLSRVPFPEESAFAPVKSLAAKICEEAAALVDGERQEQYGAPEAHFALVAQLWSAYFGIPVKASEVTYALALLKIARSKTGTTKLDTPKDAAGYCGLSGQLAEGGR